MGALGFRLQGLDLAEGREHAGVYKDVARILVRVYRGFSKTRLFASVSNHVLPGGNKWDSGPVGVWKALILQEFGSPDSVRDLKGV